MTFSKKLYFFYRESQELYVKYILNDKSNMIEKENLDSLHSLLENYEKQKRINTAADWELLRKRIASDRSRHIFFNFIRNAAAILLPLFLTYQYVMVPMLNRINTVEEIITVTSAPGMVTKTVLSDGSEVWLNSQSTLTYPREFLRNERNVKLSGEAYFKVSSDKKYRFNVETSQKTIISAYGTEFNVNAYDNEKNQEITLASGQIEVSSWNNSKTAKMLKVNEKAILNNSTSEFDIVTADTYVETAWKDGKMVFRREKLDKIAEKLSRKFGVTIHLEGDKLKEYEYTATFTDETLEDILDLLKRSAPISYSINQQKQLGDTTFTHKEIIIKNIIN